MLCEKYGWTIPDAREVDMVDIYTVLFLKRPIRASDNKEIAAFIQLNRGKWRQDGNGVWGRYTDDELRVKAKERHAKSLLENMSNGGTNRRTVRPNIRQGGRAAGHRKSQVGSKPGKG